MLGQKFIGIQYQKQSHYQRMKKRSQKRKSNYIDVRRHIFDRFFDYLFMHKEYVNKITQFSSSLKNSVTFFIYFRSIGRYIIYSMEKPMQSDLQIVTSIQKGNRDDFVTLYEKYAKKIFDFIFFKTGNKEDSEDLTSEVFLKAFNNIQKFNLEKNYSFSARLYTIAKNQIIDHFRAHHEQYEYKWLQDISIHEDLLQNIQDRDQIQSVLEFLDTLGETKKQIFILKIRNELSYEEIGHIVNKNPNTCKVDFHRTMQSIIQKFGIAILLLFIKHVA